MLSLLSSLQGFVPPVPLPEILCLSEPDLDQLCFKLRLKMHIFRNDIACLSICIFLKVFINIFYYGKIDITLNLSFIHF